MFTGSKNKTRQIEGDLCTDSHNHTHIQEVKFLCLLRDIYLWVGKKQYTEEKKKRYESLDMMFTVIDWIFVS